MNASNFISLIDVLVLGCKIGLFAVKQIALLDDASAQTPDPNIPSCNADGGLSTRQISLQHGLVVQHVKEVLSFTATHLEAMYRSQLVPPSAQIR